MILSKNYIEKIMFIKKSVDKEDYHNNGYLIIDTDLEDNQNFNNLVEEINCDLKLKTKSNDLKKHGGFIMGNFGINQGPYGPKLFSLIFKDQFVKVFEDLTENKLENFNIFYGGNLVLPKKGNQHFHIDGTYNKKMYMVSIVTEDINLNNGPTEVCIGSHKKEMKFWEFFFSKKKKKKVLLKKGQILIRPHNLWHRGTKNFSDKTRLLLSFVMTPKVKKGSRIEPVSSELVILPNFFKSNLQGRFHEFLYIYFGGIRLVIKLLYSFLRQK